MEARSGKSFPAIDCSFFFTHQSQTFDFYQESFFFVKKIIRHLAHKSLDAILPVLRHLVHDPLGELGDSRAHSRQVRLRTPDAPADDAAQEVATIVALDDERTPRITL